MRSHIVKHMVSEERQKVRREKREKRKERREKREKREERKDFEARPPPGRPKIYIQTTDQPLLRPHIIY